MQVKALPPETSLLRWMMDEGCEKKAWHGPNLCGSIRGLQAREAARWTTCSGPLRSLPGRPEWDSTGLSMQIVYWRP